MKPILTTLAAVCAAACLMTPATQAGAPKDPNQKYIEVCNNFSNQTLWLTLSATPPGRPEVRWLSGKSIAPKTCFESPALSSDQWSAGRAYIFLADPAKLTNPYAIAGNYQLVEYIFRGPAGSGGTHGEGVGYDFSAVDSVHSGLPLAVEAADDDGDPASAMPYTGIPMTADYDEDTNKLRAVFEKFIDAGWPYFKDSSVSGMYYKIPGGYNLFAEANVHAYVYAKTAAKPITPVSLANRWLYWLGTPVDQLCPAQSAPSQAFCKDYQHSVVTVWSAFATNARSNGVLDPSALDMAEHIIGFVPFGNGSNWSGIDAQIGPLWAALASGLPSSTYMQDPQYAALKYPAYDSPYNLDPYVTAVHKDFGLNIYAFSIDDALGYFDAPTQNKLFIAVGGLHGLPNKTQAKPPAHSPYHANTVPAGAR
ncbi:hypothetical protein [Dyella acidiphila]|uniref:Uncharacterized protein n=1 Tax=Dyella acidiphila TaxID=2775866 RepID=A0ABR9G9D7_9GAMM|nr:hypothetical protein [Dyella acidiphila]MBE1160664.1 hypothetical protein [Dyella acidiphila]